MSFQVIVTLLITYTFTVYRAQMFHTNILKPYNDTARGMFFANDFNRDGIFERVEIDFTFQIYDSNPEDGRVSHAEYTNYINRTTPNLSPLSGELYKMYDVDNDNLLELHDYDNFFKLMDSDGDQQVTEHEFVRYWTILLESLGHLIDSGGVGF